MHTIQKFANANQTWLEVVLACLGFLISSFSLLPEKEERLLNVGSMYMNPSFYWENPTLQTEHSSFSAKENMANYIYI